MYQILKSAGVGSIKTVTLLCEEHGEFTAEVLMTKDGKFVGRQPHCPKCAAEYYEEHKEEIEAREREEFKRWQEEEKQRKEEQRQADFKDALRKSGIPYEYWGVDLDEITFNDKTNNETLRQARLFAENFADVRHEGVGLFFYGETGTGKTHLACAVLRALMPEVRGKYTMLWKLIHEVKCAGFGEDPLQPYMQAPLLVIDEIGVQFGSKFEETSIYPLIDYRVTNRLPTIFISNVQPDTKQKAEGEETVRSIVGERVWDRIQFRSVFLPLHGASRRIRYRSVDDLVEHSKAETA